MYLGDFLDSLKLLRANAVPKIQHEIEQDVIYLGYAKTDEIDEPLRKKLPKESKMAMIYITVPELVKGVIDVSAADEYIAKLNEEPIPEEFLTLSVETANAIIYEAIWILDKMTDLPEEKSILCMSDGGIPQLRGLFHNNADDDNLPVLMTFDSLLKKDVFLAQAKYFIKKYIKSRLSITKKEEDKSSLDFINILTYQLDNYFVKQPYNVWSSKSMTGISNPEFDDFIQQISQFCIDSGEYKPAYQTKKCGNVSQKEVIENI